MRHPAKLSNILGKLNKNSQRWYMLGRTSSEVFVMLVVALHSLLFLWCCLLFIFTFLDYFSMPPALQIGFSGTGRSPPALSSTLVTFNCLTFSSHFYRERCFFEWAFFTHMCFFSYAPLLHIFAATCFYQDLPGSRQFFFEVCRTSCWSSKHRPGPSLCLIHSNTQSSYSEESVFKSYQIFP